MTSGSLRAASSTRVRAVLSAGTRSSPTPLTSVASYSHGTGDGGFDTLIDRTRSLAPGASETIDLYAGTTLPDLFGHDAPLREVKYVEIAVTDGGDASGLRVGGAASNAWAGFFADTSDMLLVFPGGPSFRGGSPAGVAVTSTARNLKVENLGAVAVEYRIVIAGNAFTSGQVMGVLGLTYP